MKKFIISAFTVIILLLTSSCTKVASPETFTFQILSSSWVAQGTPGSADYMFQHTESVPAITDDVVSTGVVLVYAATGSQWVPLPYTWTNPGYTTYENYQYQSGYLFIVLKDSDLTAPDTAGTITIKAVVLTSKHLQLLEGVDKTNYTEVSKALSIE